MTNNEILYSLCKAFDYNEEKVVEIFALADHEVTPEKVGFWLSKENDPKHLNFADISLSIFLNGLINQMRGKKEGPQPEPEKVLNKNGVLKKLKIALNLKNEDVTEILESAGLSINSYELTSYFRKPGHKNYRSIKNQTLRTFIKALRQKYNPSNVEL